MLYCRSRIALVIACVAVAAIWGCATKRGAPVVDRAPEAKPAPAKPGEAGRPAPKPGEPRADSYVVRKGDTLYSIALDHGLDYRELAQWNGITDPGVIRPGQTLRLKPPVATATAAPFKAAPGVKPRPLGDTPSGPDNIKTQPKAVRAPYSDQTYAQMAGIKPEPAPKVAPRLLPGRDAGDESVQWLWPTTGKIISTFDGNSNKGVGISGKLRQPIYASADGRVIFSGTATDSLSRLGKFIVIRHGNDFNSVYAHNSELFVKYGDTVTKGQKIAEMGTTDDGQVKLHFEIRRFGKPVDPIKLLPPA